MLIPGCEKRDVCAKVAKKSRFRITVQVRRSVVAVVYRLSVGR